MVTTTKDELKKRLGVTSEYIGKDGRRCWLTNKCIVLDADLVGAPMPELLRQLVNITKTPLDMIYRIQQGLGVYDADGKDIPLDANFRPTIIPKGYQLFNEAMAWLHSNYPGGWFYAVDTIHKANK